MNGTDAGLTHVAPADPGMADPAPALVPMEARSPQLLMPLLRELGAERCAHFWHAALASAPENRLYEAFEDVLARERKGRIFAYCHPGDRSSQAPQAVAIAAVSERIGDDFPYDGIPVLSRAYVRPQFRGRRWYAELLRHRLDYCRSRWGNELMGVHLSSASDKVERAFERAHEGRILYLGDEHIDHVGVVRAYLALTPQYERCLVVAPLPELAEERRLVSAFVESCGRAFPISTILPALSRLAERDANYALLLGFIERLLPLHRSVS